MKKFFQDKNLFLILAAALLALMIVGVLLYPGDDPDTEPDIEIEDCGVRTPEGVPCP